MFCLDNAIIQYRENFYSLRNGIVNGENNRVLTANIAMHHITKPIANMFKETNIFKRFIDDIIWISDIIENALPKKLKRT